MNHTSVITGVGTCMSANNNALMTAIEYRYQVPATVVIIL
jgi:hypothetical protein